jgi:hypothetical protein
VINSFLYLFTLTQPVMEEKAVSPSGSKNIYNKEYKIAI